MPSGQLGSLLQHLRRLIGAAPAGVAPDRQLLEQFCLQRDEAAFTALVQRHGPLVLGVCRRVLHDPQDAEDAFQATFLVLAEKAASVRRPEALSSWLYGVAYRVAARARGASMQRHTYEQQGTDMSSARSDESDRADPASESARRELRAVLDEELSRLPDKYRIPMILCYLEGKSNEEAAEQLSWTKGTVSGRLARARDLLRGRLARRGLALSAAALPGLMADVAVQAAVPAPLVTVTVNAVTQGAASATAASLAKGVIQAMGWTRLQLTLVVAFLTVGALGAGLGLWAFQAPSLASPTLTVERPAKGPAAVPGAPTDLIAFIKIFVTPSPNGAPGIGGKSFQLWIADADGKNERLLSKSAVGYPYALPGGQTLAVFDTATAKVVTVGVDGKDEKPAAYTKGDPYFRLTPHDKTGYFFAAGGKVHLQKLDPHGLPKLPAGGAVDHALASSAFTFAPDGKKIAFVRGGELVVADLAGKEEQTLTSVKTVKASNPVFTADGKIVFLSRRVGEPVLTTEICRIDADGKNLETLYSSFNTGAIRDLAVNADGTKLLYTGTRGPYFRYILLLDLRTKTETRLIENGEHPVWVDR
jgi:RNA polymerase sigma factor (sigma-70 family)